MNDAQHSPLGRETSYPDHYDPGLLYPIARAGNRAAIGIGAELPFVGCDVWNAWELSWLNARGKPEVAIARFTINAASPAIIESKSLKLYLNGFANSRLDDSAQLVAMLQRDLSAACGAAVEVALIPATDFAREQIAEPTGTCLDDIDIAIDRYGPPAPELLRSDGQVVEETLYSRLLKSNCPVTGQPDWGTVTIRYRGPRIDHAGLLRYIVSFRRHSEFHEHCVERIWSDIMRQCAPAALDVGARYTRRGGLDINPWRSNAEPRPPGNLREARQ